MFEVTVTKNFSQINIKDQTTNPGSSENTKQDKYQTHTPKYSLNFRKLKLSWKPRKKHLIYGGAKVRVTSTSLNYTNNKKVEWSISSVMRTKFTNLKCFALWTSFKVEGEMKKVAGQFKSCIKFGRIYFQLEIYKYFPPHSRHLVWINKLDPITTWPQVSGLPSCPTSYSSFLCLFSNGLCFYHPYFLECPFSTVSHKCQPMFQCLEYL